MQNKFVTLSNKDLWKFFVSGSAFGTLGVVCFLGYYMVYLDLSLELSAWLLIIIGGSLISLLIAIGIALFARRLNPSFIFLVFISTLAGGSSGTVIGWLLFLFLEMLEKTHLLFADFVLVLTSALFLALSYIVAIYAGVSIAVGFPLFISRVFNHPMDEKRLFLIGAIAGAVIGVILFVLTAGFRDYLAFTFVSAVLGFQFPAVIGGMLAAIRLSKERW